MYRDGGRLRAQSLVRAWGLRLPGVVMQAPLVELRRADLDEPVADRAPAILLDLGNVIPFVRANARSTGQDVAAQISTVSERPVPQTLDRRDQRLLIALLLASLALHVVVLGLLWRPAPPLPGIELAPMEVEIIVSDASRASPSATAREAAPSPSPDQQQPPKEEPDASPPTPQATQPPPQQEAESTPIESKPPPPEQPQQQALAPPEQPPQAEPAPVPPQIIPPPEQLKKTPTEVAPIKPERAQQPPTPSQHKAPPREANPHQEVAPRGRATSNAQKASAGAKPSAGSPARKTSADPNYAGKVFAHLARFKRMPPDAQKNRSQGTVRVRFVIDGRGNVGSVQLVGSSGVASLDQEALAWPRRASPFPPPPGGQSIPITAPVSFHF
jgi:periplasmic protein TonB